METEKANTNNIDIFSLEQRIIMLLENSRKKIVSNVNTTMVQTYFEIGRNIVEYEQQGEARAKYGKQVIKKLSQRLTLHFGKGFSVDNLENMRKFYLNYKNSETVFRNFT